MDEDLQASDAEAFRAQIDWLNLNQSSFAAELATLGDRRELKTILRSVQRMATGEARVSGEMLVILMLMSRDRSRAKRIADAADWVPYGENGGFKTTIQGVELWVSPQSKGRWSIGARHVADGRDGYSPSYPHWRDNLQEAKIRAVLAVDETLDGVERIKAEVQLAASDA